MEYFLLKKSTDQKIIGRRYPQCSIDYSVSYNIEAPNSITKFSPWTDAPSDLLVPPRYLLHGHAKLTDLLSQGSHGAAILLLSERLFELIKLFTIPKVQLFETTVVARKKLHNYFLIYLPENCYHFIDFGQSKFSLVPMGAARPVQVFTPEINSLEDFKNWIKEYPYLIQNNPKRLKVVADKLVFDSNDISYDIFRIIGPVQSSSYFVSERLKNAIEEKGFTGMEFVALDKIRTVLPPL